MAIAIFYIHSVNRRTRSPPCLPTPPYIACFQDQIAFLACGFTALEVLGRFTDVIYASSVAIGDDLQ